MGDQLRVAFANRTEAVDVRADTTLGQLGKQLAALFGVRADTVKLLAAGGKHVSPASNPDQTLAQAGIKPGSKFKMLASTTAAVAAVQAARVEARAPSLEHELARELARHGKLPSASGGGARPPAGPYTFKSYEAWQRPGLTPPPSEALKLLHRLAADPGILGVMRRHRWTVGLLSEMLPAGKVGVSPVCVLGVNINVGQEISLRLRTDDLQGFRRYDKIRETLIHELAHMVHSEHDNSFKELNSQLRRECEAFDWKASPAAHPLTGLAGADRYEGAVQYSDLPTLQQHKQQGAMAATAVSSGQTLRQLAGSGHRSSSSAVAPAPADPRAAAAAAALRRAGRPAATEAAAGPAVPHSQQQQGQEQQQQQREHPQQQQRQYAKGEAVLYVQRDGSTVPARVVAVDQSVAPPSYGVELDGKYRETEGSRLLPLPPQDHQQQQQQGEEEEEDGGEVQGLGHRDAATEAKEDAMRRLEMLPLRWQQQAPALASVAPAAPFWGLTDRSLPVCGTCARACV